MKPRSKLLKKVARIYRRRMATQGVWNAVYDFPTFVAQIDESGIAGSFPTGPLDTGYFGDITVEKPSWRDHAKQWLASLGVTRSVYPKDFDQWSVYAERMGVGNKDIKKGWKLILKGRGATVEHCKKLLLMVMLESPSPAFTGYGAPMTGPDIKEFDPDQPGINIHNAEERSKNVRRIWKAASKELTVSPEQTSRQVLQNVTTRLGIPPEALRPEEWHQLDLGLSFLSNGFPPPNRIGGAPGGPFRTGGTEGAP